ncbi:MAG: cysteine--tRNA ligase [Lysobacterales bacterium]
MPSGPVVLRLHNSLTRRTEPFEPLDPARVTMYVCGPTVYNHVHIGNARPAVVFGLLARLLRRHYPRVVYARNITDVDDKINAAAAAAGVPIDVVTRRYADAWHHDIAALGVDPPDVEPRATEHIPAIIAMCRKLLVAGHAYVAEGHVLFDVDSFPNYGRLSGRSTEDMIAGARVEVAPYKRNPADFVLWKPSPAELPGWDSPWGRGRPGWHIECSAMSAAHLGETIDIHAGGNDLMFPHHENEIAQSTCAHGGRTFARFWLHNGMLTFGGRKMSKSLGNVIELHALLQQYPAEVLRHMLLKAHYRQPLDWSDDSLAQSQATLDGWYGALRDLAGVDADVAAGPLDADIDAALCDDLNTPQALAAFARLVDAARAAGTPTERRAAKSALRDAGAFLGLLQGDPEAWFQTRRAPAGEAATGSGAFDGDAEATVIRGLVAERQTARAQRDFRRADAIRDQLTRMGIVVEDSADGSPRWKYANR